MSTFPMASLPAHASAMALGKELFGGRMQRLDYIPRGVMNHKFKAQLLDGESYVIRVYPPSREHVVDYEPDLLKRCEAAGLPVPKVTLDSKSGPKVGHNYIVYPWMEGIPLDERLPFLDRQSLAMIAGQLVLFLTDFARLGIKGFGELVTAHQGQFGTWSEFVDATFSKPPSVGEKCRIGLETMARVFAFGKEGAAILCDRECVLTWGDVSPENILLDTGDRIAGFVDFEGAMAADYSLTLGYCYARYFGTPFCDALLKAWPAREDRRVLGFYALLRAIRLVRFADLQMPTGHPRKSVDEILPGYRDLLNQMHDPTRKERL